MTPYKSGLSCARAYVVLLACAALTACGGGGGGANTAGNLSPADSPAASTAGVREDVAQALQTRYGSNPSLLAAGLRLAAQYETVLSSPVSTQLQARAAVLDMARAERCVLAAAPNSIVALGVANRVALLVFNTQERIAAKGNLARLAGGFILPDFSQGGCL